MIDSLQAQRVAAARNNTLVVASERVALWLDRSVGSPQPTTTPATPDTTGALHTRSFQGADFVVLPTAQPSLDRVFDSFPPFRSGGVIADLDNQLWILPATSRQSKAGELVYDVVSTKGELVRRVRIPLGRFVVGFGRGGVVYLAVGNLTNGFSVERSTLPMFRVDHGRR